MRPVLHLGTPLGLTLSTTFIEIPCSNREAKRGGDGEKKKEENEGNVSDSFYINGRSYNANQTVQRVPNTLGLCSEPIRNVLGTVGREMSSRCFVSSGRPTTTSALVCDEQRGDRVCSSVCGGIRVNDKENGTGDCCEYGDYEEKDILVHTDSTLFSNGLDENGLATTDKQLSLHLTATDRAHDIIPEGCWSGLSQC